MRKSAPMGKDCVGDDESKSFLERVCYSSSPDAVFTGSTKCLSIIPVVIEREMNVSEREGTSWGKQQCSAVRGGERPGFFSLDLSSLVSAEPALWNVCSFVYLLSLQGWQLVGAAS